MRKKKFKEINEAHEVLGDPENRRKYDELGARWSAGVQAPPGWDGQAGRLARAASRNSSSGSTAPASAISLNSFSVAAGALAVSEGSGARKPSHPGGPRLPAVAEILKAISWLRLKRR